MGNIITFFTGVVFPWMVTTTAGKIILIILIEVAAIPPACWFADWVWR